MSAFIPVFGASKAILSVETGTGRPSSCSRRPRTLLTSSSFSSSSSSSSFCTTLPSSFSSPSPSPYTTTTTCQLTTERLANKSYQLEEDEDDTSCTTALYFKADGTVSMGRTDGPDPDRVNAKWQFDSTTGQLVLDIERYFEGEAGIEFMVKRILRGHLDLTRREELQDLPVFTGAMYPYPTDFSKHSEVGFFAMILATDDLPSDDFDISKERA